MTKKGLAQALSVAAGEHAAGIRESDAYRPVIGAITTLVAACQADGSFRKGIDPDDVLLLINGLFRMDPNGRWRAQADRLSDFFIHGLAG